jgi:DNA-binding response OmpR family regulator
MRVVVVEDDADLGAALVDLLLQLGHDVVLTKNAPLGVQVILAQPPDIVFVDILLPVFDGNILAAEVRRQSAVPPYLVAVTGYPDSVMSHLFDDVLVKPCAAADIERAVRQAELAGR